MENKVIKAQEYILPKLNHDQKTIELIDINGIKFQAIFETPTTKDILLMEAECNDFIEKDGVLFQKSNKPKKIEWILKKLLVAPTGLGIEHLNKLSAEEIADTFR
ncbi:hypothetical protein [Cetobacterium sp.]|uniref:hypothetical protein n=1 Tax=Cetobacterium sp. TaxID=2071632 RepID=UPI003EE7C6E6